MLRENRYKQIVHALEQDILNGKYKVGDKIPSINSWRIRTGLSRSSIILAFRELQARGIIESEQSIGYFVKSTRIEILHHILLIFGVTSLFKEDLIKSITRSLGGGVQVDIMFHNADRDTFNILLDQVAGKYTIYVLTCWKFDNIENRLRKLGGKVILVDNFVKSLRGKFSSAYQDFERTPTMHWCPSFPQSANIKSLSLYRTAGQNRSSAWKA